MNISPNFTLHELTASQVAERRGINNAAPLWVIENLRGLSAAVLQPVRDHFESPVIVSSGWRCQALERALKDKPDDWISPSQHTLGEAADFEVVGVSNLDVARWIATNVVTFDQLILEFHTPSIPSSGWIHCSHVRPNRAETLTAIREQRGGVTYVPGLPSPLETP